MFGKVWQALAERFLDRDRDVPEVNISLSLGEARADTESSESQRGALVHWTMKLALNNETTAPAADLKLIWPSARPSVKAVLPYHLNPFEEKVVLLRGETAVDRQSFEAAGPDEQIGLLLQNPSLILTYRDVRGDYFHTRYARSGGQESVEYLKDLPPDSD
jgi:hypothetical protein